MRSLLSVPFAYRILMTAVGGTRGRRAYVSDHIRPVPSCRVLDLGCGPADILDAMPPVRYVGVDVHAPYIMLARRRFPDATFIVNAIQDLPLDTFGGFDRVLATGVLHHLDDAGAARLIEIAASALAVGGVFVALDPCWEDDQSWLSRAFISADRGRFVRRAEQYAGLVRQKFSSVETVVRRDLLRVPYTHSVVRATHNS